MLVDIVAKVRTLGDNDLRNIWEALKGYNPQENYTDGITMDDWAETVYSEMCDRGLPRIPSLF